MIAILELTFYPDTVISDIPHTIDYSYKASKPEVNTPFNKSYSSQRRKERGRSKGRVCLNHVGMTLLRVVT